MRAVFLDYATVSYRDDLDPSGLLRALPELEFRPQTAQPGVTQAIEGAGAVLVNKLRIGREAIAATPTLKLVALAATGTNNVDLDAARERGVAVCNLRDYCTASVVQHVMGTLLLLTHRLREYDALVRSGAWQKGEQFCLLEYPIRELCGRRFGVVGYGTLGRAVGRAAQAFGMELAIANRPGGAPEPGRVNIAELLPTVDVLSLHCPLTPRDRRADRRFAARVDETGCRADQHRARSARGWRGAGRPRSGPAGSVAPRSTCCPRSHR
jgi:glycerate dehydrogenase